MPKESAEQTRLRAKAIKLAMREVTEIPLATLKRCPRVLELLIETARHGNLHTVSDSGAGGAMALACAEGAYYNVRINLLDFKDGDSFAITVRADAEGSITHTRELAERLRNVVDERMEELRRQKGR
jgi:formiminotetrahydrofolate cyclodeaminase